ncbi:MAG TPA: aromatic ring-hydroxylating dioxygenase subunit alpha [Ramlibacter sp.]|uniref:aromatic ring-hydroxylating dioxygenase subunit alpha n=1 Tax=Ramlibacter sp. TaxID=1917967 RepID=UPI002D7E5049|nr:aromatic ring-hydroxylating dioxygenase subunit alpha [Ramlibacter sp.]HET8744669.1 aromatic ring-hydroxylating dioxygenase subunit alpha [Ramlibacter sp.]
MKEIPIRWQPGTYTRVPYGVFQREDVLEAEQRRIFEGPVWNFLGLEAEVPNAGDFKSTFVGRMPVVMTRDTDGEVYAFENRCAHRGALICLDEFGNAPEHTCVYHAWRYDLQGNLRGIAFDKGVNGKGGMPESFCREHHGPRKLRTTTFCGLVFGSLHDDVPPIEEYLGEEVTGRLERVLGRPVEVIGRFTQALPNNWKLYTENVRDTYHASLLHTFFTTFGITRLTQEGGVIISEDGGNHASASYSRVIDGAEGAYKQQAIRSDNQELQIGDLSMLESVDEIGDGIVLQILSVFPGFVLQQIQNCLAVRQLLPKGVERSELNWTYLGFADDTPEQRNVRLKQLNLVGPGGFISMEDGAVGGFVQRGIAGAQDLEAIVEMGGDSVASSDGRATETSVRGFWKAYRRHMEI